MVSAEDVVGAIKEGLESPAFLEVLTQIYADKGDTEVYNAVEVHKSLKWNPTVFPCAEIETTYTRNNRPDSYGLDLNYEVTIFWHDRDSDEEVVATRIRRALAALRKFFEDNQYLNGFVSTPIVLGDDMYSPFVPTTEFEGRPFIKSGSLTLYVRTLN